MFFLDLSNGKEILLNNEILVKEALKKIVSFFTTENNFLDYKFKIVTPNNQNILQTQEIEFNNNEKLFTYEFDNLILLKKKEKIENNSPLKINVLKRT